MELLKHFLIRFLIIGLPLIGLYFYSQIAFEANLNKEHPVDAGLGIAILIFTVLFIMFVGLFIDLGVRMIKKQNKIALTNVPFLLLFIIPISYIGCQFTTNCEDCFCSWLINLF